MSSDPTLPAPAQSKKEHGAKFISPVFLLGAAGLLWAAHHEYTITDTLMTHGIKGDGKVISLYASHSNDDGTSYYPMVEFQDHAGNKIVFKGHIGSNPASYDEGDNVKIMYLQDNPKDTARIDLGLINWLVPGCLFISSILFGYVGLLFIRSYFHAETL